ncbi:MAG: hypothetical protein WCT03_15110 [Candidatus Obscuribacterales bacterium]|jgi:hypothetical protein
MTVTELRKKRAEFIGMLSQLCNDLYDLSMDATIVEKTDSESDDEFDARLFALQDLFELRAAKLKKALDLLFYNDFRARTAEFEVAYVKLKDVNEKVQKELEGLEKLVEKLRQFNQFLQLVDQAIVIAAGLAKSA